uniref:Uncharacterized protein n=1 Tax=Caenorhabditis japonica TaxID=281687 RepID=A0A8R1DKM4_CAEJA
MHSSSSSVEEILSSYSSLTVTSNSRSTTLSTRDSVSKSHVIINEQLDDDDEDEVFEDASSDISILTRRHDPLPLDRAKIQVAVLHDLCQHTQKVFEPLFLRKCEVQKVRQGTAPPSVFPIEKVELLAATKKLSGHSALLVSLDAPTFCARYLAANVLCKSKNVLIYTSPMYFVRFVARPDPQTANLSTFDDVSEDVHLMMSPDVAQVAKKMLPRWQTVTFTLAFGKHVAVKYRIIETRRQPVTYVKARQERVKRVPTSALYRTEPVQRAERWTSFKVHELQLSTVERSDPQIVKRVFLEQTSLVGAEFGEGDVARVVVEEEEQKKKVKKSSMKKVSRKFKKEHKMAAAAASEELNLMWQRTDIY